MSLTSGVLTPSEFVAKWSRAELSERAASHEHFIDLCHLLGQPTPASADATGEEYTFEKHVKVVGAASKGSKGDHGFVDVWWRGKFAWEYKQKDKYKSLDEAYRQVYQYRDALLNPPLSVVCDIRTTEIRSHFPNHPTEKTVIRLEEIPGRIEVLRRVFTNPESFRPAKTTEAVTKDLANEFSELANRLIDRYPPGNMALWDTPGDPVAHFLMKVMFCLFAEDIGLLPDKAFTKLIERSLRDPESFITRAATLFTLMKTGGEFGNDLIPHFNGGLFDDAPPLSARHRQGWHCGQFEGHRRRFADGPGSVLVDCQRLEVMTAHVAVRKTDKPLKRFRLRRILPQHVRSTDLMLEA